MSNSIIIPWVGHRNTNKDVYIDTLEDHGIIVNKELRRADIALERIVTNKYPLIITEEFLAPGNSGIALSNTPFGYDGVTIELIKRIRQIPEYQHITIITIGDFTKEVSSPRTYLRAGATEIINLAKTRPIQPEQFADKIRTYLSSMNRMH